VVDSPRPLLGQGFRHGPDTSISPGSARRLSSCDSYVPDFLQSLEILALLNDRVLVFIDNFDARGEDELTLRRGEKVELVELDEGFGDGWYLGKHTATGKTGLFPGGICNLSLLETTWRDTFQLTSLLSLHHSPPEIERATACDRLIECFRDH
jgi:hypothetical protein